MCNVIYEAKSVSGISLPFIMLIVATVISGLLLLLFWRRTDIKSCLFYLSVFLFLVFIIFCQVYVAIDAKVKVYNAYIDGEYLTVQGEITGYTLAEEGQPNLPDSFYVDGVDFSVPGFVSAWGYPLKSVDGGILCNGMNVKIYYIPYKFENVIMKIEQLEE